MRTPEAQDVEETVGPVLDSKLRRNVEGEQWEEEEVWSQSGVSPGDKKHSRAAVTTRTMSEGDQKGPGRICNKGLIVTGFYWIVGAWQLFVLE